MITVLGTSLMDLKSNDGTLMTLIEDTAANLAAFIACCCGTSGCTGCCKWLSDEAGKFVVTLTVAGCGINQTETPLELLGSTNCGDVYVQSNAFGIFSAGVQINFSCVDGTWIGQIIANLNEANCTMAETHTVITYECVQCSHFLWSATVAVSGDECSCGGEVITFTVEVDLTGGIGCP